MLLYVILFEIRANKIHLNNHFHDHFLNVALLNLSNETEIFKSARESSNKNSQK